MKVNNLQAVEKAVEQLDNGLRKGPVIRLLSVLIVLLIISVTFNIKLLLDSRERELDLMEKVIKEVRRQAPVIIEQQFEPVKKQVGEVITKADSTLTKTDSLLNQASEMKRK